MTLKEIVKKINHDISTRLVNRAMEHEPWYKEEIKKSNEEFFKWLFERKGNS